MSMKHKLQTRFNQHFALSIIQFLNKILRHKLGTVEYLIVCNNIMLSHLTRPKGVYYSYKSLGDFWDFLVSFVISMISVLLLGCHFAVTFCQWQTSKWPAAPSPIISDFKYYRTNLLVVLPVL